MSAITFIDIFDPRGRADRRGFAIAAIVLLAAQGATYLLLLALDVPLEARPVYVIHCSFIWVALVATAKRLHDLGLGALKMVWAIGLLVVWSFVVALAALTIAPDATFEPGSSDFLMVIALTSAPMLVALIWLHLKKGEPSANRFGPAPGASGFSFPCSVQANLLASRLNPSRIGS